VARAALALVAPLLLFACASPLRTPPPPLDALRAPGRPAAPADDEPWSLWQRRPDPAAVAAAAAGFLDAALAADEGSKTRRAALVGAARAFAWLADHETDRDRRGEHAAQALRTAQHCAGRNPGDAECRYWLAIGLGLAARERPSRAVASLNEMIGLLEGVAAERPLLEHAGPDRVLALVYLRAPGWPSGPGDPERALEHAERAVRLVDDHPPNLLAYAEALAEGGRQAEARAAREQALAAARALALEGDPDAPAWMRSAEDERAADHP
jgi:tetratricopeptide (TPR) repeat protein